MPSLGIAPRSERCTDPSTMSAQSMAPVSGIFPTDGSLHRLEIRISGNPAFAISRGSRGASSLTPELNLTAAFLACSCPRHLSDRGKPLDPETSVASRCVELLQAELDCIRWPG